MKQVNGVMLATVLATAAAVRAQPAPGDPAGPGPGGNDAGSAVPPVDAAPPASAGPALDPGLLRGGAIDPTVAPAPHGPPRPKVDHPPIDFPEVLTTPTGWLLGAGVLYSRTALDTGGGVTSDNRVGLGDVAEFGVATTDEVRERSAPDDKPERIQPYITASFRMGIAENRLFTHQPGVTLGFLKSFERNHNGEKTRIAELTLVASKHVGSRFALHLGGALWDASLQSNAVVADGADPPPEVTLHGHGSARQVRVFGGLEARPLARSEILIDLGWAPEFCYQCVADTDKITLRPELSWGVRYEVARYLHLESGVRVPDIGKFNLLDAQIFGQIAFTSFALRDAVDRLK